MSDLMRYTVFGHFLRLISRGKLLPWAEQKDSPIVKKYTAVKPENDDASNGLRKRNSKEDLTGENRGPLGSPSDSTSTVTVSSDHNVDTNTGTRADKEKGQDLYLIEFSEDDPEVSGTKLRLTCLS